MEGFEEEEGKFESVESGIVLLWNRSETIEVSGIHVLLSQSRKLL